MDDHIGKADLKMNANELLAFQKELKQEQELLKKILSKIDNQVHSLQVEQLHLLGLVNKSLKDSEEKSPLHESEDNMQDYANKSLDLSIASNFKYFQEENDDDDDT
ncbi:uncharacterized protein LOC143340397 [Colletes latitarsis]|uniref:uncharacterized protein LOC143340397 n=1 Tax=Colletes latitarsis TaxID=2605962 RepID=UPI004036779B